ncbi:hypothetical protein KIPB_009535, partial [Kipferlia bialata]|eukprot:g9535.t1
MTRPSLRTIMAPAYTNEEVKALCEAWLQWDMDEVTKAEVRERLANEEYEHLYKVMSSRLEFGTAGLRGKLAAGYGCMNELVITQAAQGLYNYAVQKVPDLAKRGIVLGYDGRYYSQAFAAITAATFLVKGCKVYLFSTYAPTPYVPFALTSYNAGLGVMVTASHNPAKDNGYKVYWSDGVQILPPHDSGIEASILASLEPWAETADRAGVIAKGTADGMVVDPYAIGFVAAYNKAISPLHFNTAALNKTLPKFGYSAMWGVGYKPCCDALKEYGFDPEQMVAIGDECQPDPLFGGCPKPNPEERHNMERCVAFCKPQGITLILANDPDADRLALAEMQEDGHYHIFHGNEIGTLLGDWVASNWTRTYPEDKIAMVNSTVSSKALRALCNKYQARYAEVLTGFKWIGRTSNDIEAEGEGVKAVFGYEEAIGFAAGQAVRDKDGVSTVCVAAEMAAALYKEGKTIKQRMDEIFNEIGWFRYANSSVTLSDMSIIGKVFDNLMNGGSFKGRSYISAFGEYKIKEIRDLCSPGYDSETEGN